MHIAYLPYVRIRKVCIDETIALLRDAAPFESFGLEIMIKSAPAYAKINKETIIPISRKQFLLESVQISFDPTRKELLSCKLI